MKWQDRGTSEDVEDRRGGGGGGLGGGGARLGLGGTVVVLALSLIFKQDFFSLLGVGPGGPAPIARGGTAPRRPAEAPEDKKLVGFVSFVLDDVQATWKSIVPSYRRAKLVLFEDGTRSGCGDAQSAMGPFYCPVDEKVYIDLGFYRELRTRYGAPGDFAEAYVLAHEIGHHVQNVLGTEQKLRAAQRAEPARRNELSIRMELQADCYAGLWAHASAERKLLDAGDIEEGMAAAAAVGDDRLQKAATGRVMPERWTHGASAQRVRWFQRGYRGSGLPVCDTFSATQL